MWAGYTIICYTHDYTGAATFGQIPELSRPCLATLASLRAVLHCWMFSALFLVWRGYVTLPHR